MNALFFFFRKMGSVPASLLALIVLLSAMAPANAALISARSSSSLGRTNAAAGAFTIAKPTGTTVGDVMIASIGYRPCSNSSGGGCTTSITAPAGWILIRLVEQKTGGGTGGNGLRLGIWYRVVTASDASVPSYTWTIGGAPVHNGAAGVVSSFINVDTTSPIVIDAGQATNSSRSHTTPNIGPLATNTLLVSTHAALSSATWTPPAGMTEILDWKSEAGISDLGMSLEINNEQRSAPGLVGTRTATFSNPPATDAGATHILALRPIQADPTIAMTRSGNLIVGSTASYALTIGNNGPASISAVNITVTDTLPAGLTYTSRTGTGWTCSAAGQVVTCTYSGAALASGATLPVLTLNVNVVSGTSWTNTATVSSGADGDNDITNSTATNTWPTNITTLATGTDPGATTIGPSALATDVNRFTLITNSLTEPISSVTVNLSSNTGIDTLAITDNLDNVLGSVAFPSSSGSITIPVINMTANTTLQTFKVRVTPLVHVSMPAPPGGTYTITAPVTAWTGPAGHAGSDTNANALTIDNISPSSATATSAIPGNQKTTLNWITSSSSDFSTTSGSVVYRWASATAGSEVPIEGSSPLKGEANGSATVACVVSSAISSTVPRVDGSGGSSDCTNTALASGQQYTYKIFQKDTRGNFDAGVLMAQGCVTSTVGGNTVVTCNANGSVTFPSGITLAIVEAWGGGGGGASNGNQGGGGGGGGAYAKANVTVVPGTTYSISVGAAGAAGAVGGSSQFDTGATVKAAGGSGASGGTAGAGGTTAASVGTTLKAGGSGGAGQTGGGATRGGGGGGGSATASANGGAGNAGSAGLGGTGGSGTGAGGSGGNDGASGTAGAAPGGGGGGGGRNFSGGAGGSGVVIIRYSLSSFDHLRIEHDGQGATCGSDSITIKACGDISCNTLYSDGGISGTLQPFNTPFTIGGIGFTTLAVTPASSGTLTLDVPVASISPVPGNISVCLNTTASSSSCSMYVSACPGGANFDCLETAISSYSTVNARLFTKLAGSGFSFDVVALRDSAGTVETAYVGIDGVAKAVTVELVDASNTVIGTQSVTFAAGNTTGRTTTSTYTINTASPSVGCKVTDSVASKVGTSTDRFSIRPIAFAVSSTNATNTGTSGTPIFKAGSDSFNLTATALAGYNGTPLIDSTLLIGTPTADSISGNFGAAAAATGIAVGNAFTYSEVGNLGMQANAVYDGSFTAIDQSNDCTNDFSTSLVGGKYGCKIGSQAVAQTTGSSGFGRFIPDHFTLISSSVPSVFSYMGQPFKAHYAIEARNGSTPSMKTSNYSGAYAPGVASVAAENANSGTDLVVSLAPRITGLTGSWSNGIYSVSVANNATFARGTEPDGPYDTLVLGVKVTDTDGPTLQALDMNPTTDVTDVACVSGGIVTNCTHKMIGTLTSIRYGRLRLQNAFGSERLPLTVPAEVQYYNVDHWATNMLDGSSPPTPWGVSPAVSTALLGGTGNATPSLGTTLVSGKASLSASAPGTGTYGYLDLTVTVPDYLKFPWTGGSAIDPTARVTFGIYKGNDRIIYRREIR